MDAVSAMIQRLSRGTGVLGQAAMAFMAVSIFYDVVMRYLFAAPTFWALEVNTFLLLFLCTIPLADVQGARVNIRVTFLIDRLPPRIVRRLDVLRGVLGILFCAAMIWKGTAMALLAFEHNDRMSTSLGTPMFIPYMILPVGFFLLALQFAVLIKAALGPLAEAGAGPASSGVNREGSGICTLPPENEDAVEHQ